MTEIEAISTDDVRIEKVLPLSAPGVVMNELPLSEAQAHLVSDTRASCAQIMKGQDDRLVAIVGPCSIHDHKAAIEYAGLLKEKAEAYKDELVILMRVYFEKPRTTVGWKGYINDPDLNGSCEINEGLVKARELLLELSELGVAAGTEFLDTITPQYIADIVSWGAIGARTTECQLHRQLASGLSMPVGFKNGTDGNIKIAVDAIGAAKGSHHFLSVTKHGVAAHVQTKGNDDCHVILRGHSSGTNYEQEAISEVTQALSSASLSTQVMVDFSHGIVAKITIGSL